MENYKIKHAEACYTGGGVYIYYGQLEDGLWFRASDGNDFIEICNADTSTDDADYVEFYEEHGISVLTDNDFIIAWNEILNWIITNEPTGNYQSYELEKRKIKAE